MTPTPTERVKAMARALEELRANGWTVAVHNDYRLNGEAHTFWLFTHPDGRYVKGEGRTDDEALTLAAEKARPVEGGADHFWLILHEPGCTPERKGPWPHVETKTILREFIRERPTAYIDVVTVHPDGPLVQWGPEVLQMSDGRSMGVGREHNKRVRDAHAHHHLVVSPIPPAPKESYPGATRDAEIAEASDPRLTAAAQADISNVQTMMVSSGRPAPAPPVSEGVETLPHDVVIGHIRFRKGVKLEVFVAAARRWYETLAAHQAREGGKP